MLVGIVGRIEPSKRQLVFLEAAEQVMQRVTRSVTFFVVGEVRSDEYLEELRQFIRKSGLEGSVFFTGRRDDIPEVLGSLDILVSLSGGSVMFEAMSCGKAVISAGFTPKEDAVHIQDGKTGVLVNSDHPSDLACALLQLIDNSETRKQIGHQARKWAEKNFCHLKMAEKTQELYNRLIQR